MPSIDGSIPAGSKGAWFAGTSHCLGMLETGASCLRWTMKTSYTSALNNGDNAAQYLAVHPRERSYNRMTESATA